MTNGVENIRQLQGNAIQVAKNDAAVTETRQMDGSIASSGFSQGNSDTIGSRIPGAFSQINKTRIQLKQPENEWQKIAQSKNRLKNAAQRIHDIRDS